ncbi:hypothetical protein D3C71_2121130 [compost metagenome]
MLKVEKAMMIIPRVSKLYRKKLIRKMVIVERIEAISKDVWLLRGVGCPSSGIWINEKPSLNDLRKIAIP